MSTSIRILYTTGIGIVLAMHTFAQATGDEDREMFNRAKARDQNAIDEAVNGWWTASMKTHEQRIQWWREARFGMFIHWGIYSLPGGEWKGKKVGGYAEHLMRKEKISRKDYLELAHQFNPVNFNADQWVLQAKQAGMKYFVITAKHHDGFAMYNSAVSDFDIKEQTPFKRDPMAELAAACRKHGMRFGFYYSHAFDWEHPDAPGNDWEYNNPGGDKLLHGGARWYDEHPELLPKARQYVMEKSIPQIKELINKYHPDILWFDTPHKLPLSENIRILQAIRETDPNVVVNGRLARSPAISFGDYKNTADRPAEFYPVEGDWEAIPTTNESYGYSKYDSSHKSVAFFIQLLARAASKGGNLLMNIGPMGDGRFDQKDISILHGIGKWIGKNEESIYGTVAGPLPYHSWGVSTLKDNRLYLHVFHWPKDGKLFLSCLSPFSVTNGHLLANPSQKIGIQKNKDGYIQLNVPVNAPDSINTVIVLDWKGQNHPGDPRLVVPNTEKERFLAFDARLNGNGFSFGDGKADRYYVENWKKDQDLGWEFRTINDTPATFKIVIKYIAPAETAGGSYTLLIERGDRKTPQAAFQYKGKVTAGKSNAAVTEELGTVSLDRGFYNMKILPAAVTKNELMKLLEVQFVRTEKK
jgi:alpha-L-fucosidase